MGCNCTSGGSGPILLGEGGITVLGSGTPTDPFRISQGQNASSLQLEVRDSETVNFTLFGAGTRADPYIIRADTSSASSLRSLGDVSATPSVFQGATPMWIGSSAGGRFEFRSPGVRYTTNATRGFGLYQGEVIREQDTQKRYEWDGSQWVDLAPPFVPPTALDPSVIANAGTLDSNTNWNTLTDKGGTYRVSTFASNVNAPSGAYNYGLLTVFISGLSVVQQYVEHGSNGFVWTRSKFNASDWNSWRRSINADDVGTSTSSLSARITQEVTDRTNGVNSVNGRVNDEINARSFADGQLGGRIDQEIRDRTNGVNGIRGEFQSADQGLRNEYNNQRVYGTNYSSKICSGNVLVNNFVRDSNTGKYVGTADIGLPSGSAQFSNIPNIVATAQSADSDGVVASTTNRSATGFQLVVSRRNNFATGVDWFASGI